VRPKGCLTDSKAICGCVGVCRVVHGDKKLRIRFLLWDNTDPKLAGNGALFRKTVAKY